MNTFNPLDYLNTYYTEVDAENRALLRFWHELPVQPTDTVIEVGCGPTLFSAIPIIHRCEKMVLADALQENLDEIQNWKGCAPHTFSWMPTIHYYVNSIADQNELTLDIVNGLSKRTYLKQLDIHNPKHRKQAGAYNILITAFCLAEASSSLVQFQYLFTCLSQMVVSGGIMAVVTGIKGHNYEIGNGTLPMTYVTRKDVSDCFLQNTFIDPHPTYIPICEDRGYKEIMGIWARKL